MHTVKYDANVLKSVTAQGVGLVWLLYANHNAKYLIKFL